VEDLGLIVLFRYGQQNVVIPSRIFPDDAERVAFLTAAAAHQGGSRKCPAITIAGSGLPIAIFSPLPAGDIPKAVVERQG
jgi:hypothetical protein